MNISDGENLVPESNKDKPCIFCGSSGSGKKGEHALPKWFLKTMIGDGPFEYFENGAELTLPNHQNQFTTQKPLEIVIPCCPSCNGRLNDRFETPLHRIGEDAIRLNQPLNIAEAKIVCDWWVKTLLLLVHPAIAIDSRFNKALGTSLVQWPNPEPGLYQWMTTQSDPPPPWLCLFAYTADETVTDPSVDSRLPQISLDGKPFHIRNARVALLELGFILVAHPDWKQELEPSIKHGMVRLCPSQATINPGDFPPLPQWPIRFA